MAQRYRVGSEVVAADAETFQTALEQAQARKFKVFCLCRTSQNLRMYIARRHDRLVLARWPGSGSDHATSCDHFEAPDHLTGMGQVKGGAVIEDEESGEALLKVQFPLTRGAARAAPTALSNDKSTVKSTGQKLSMRGLLHFLWDKAELTHWHPKMAGKRSWFVVRRALLEAASGCRVKQKPLSEVLFVPESFDKRNVEGWRSRRDAALQRVRFSREDMLIAIGELKEVTVKNMTERVVLKHAGLGFSMDADMARRFHKRFGDLIEARENLDDRGAQIVFMGSFSGTREGSLQLVECTMMLVTREWIPFETIADFDMIGSALHAGRRFVKAMRVNLEREVPIASLFLKDTGELATAVYSLDTAVSMSAESLHDMDSGLVDHFVWGVHRDGERAWPAGRVEKPSSLGEVAAAAKRVAAERRVGESGASDDGERAAA